MSTAETIILSAFAALGLYYFLQIALGMVFHRDVERVVTVVPVVSKDVPLAELLRTVNSMSPGSRTIVVDLCGLEDAQQYVDGGQCAVVTTPEKLGEAICGVMDRSDESLQQKQKSLS